MPILLYHGTNGTYVRTSRAVRTYHGTFNVMSQLSDWKRAHMCTENHVCIGRIHGSQLREGANEGQHTPTLSLPREVYRGNRHYNVCEHVGLDTNQSLHHPLSATSWGDGPLKYPWVRESAAGRDPWDPGRVSRKRWARLYQVL